MRMTYLRTMLSKLKKKRRLTRLNLRRRWIKYVGDLRRIQTQRFRQRILSREKRVTLLPSRGQIHK